MLGLKLNHVSKRGHRWEISSNHNCLVSASSRNACTCRHFETCLLLKCMLRLISLETLHSIDYSAKSNLLWHDKCVWHVAQASGRPWSGFSIWMAIICRKPFHMEYCKHIIYFDLRITDIYCNTVMIQVMACHLTGDMPSLKLIMTHLTYAHISSLSYGAALFSPQYWFIVTPYDAMDLIRRWLR